MNNNQNVSILTKKSNINNKISDFSVVNTTIKNTYILLSMTLLFSGLMAFLSSITNAPYPGIMLSLILNIFLIYVVNTLRNSAWGVLAVFLFTGFFGYTLGPILNMVLLNFVNASELIATSLGLTGLIFVTLSCYAFTTKKDFSYLQGFVVAGIVTSFILFLIAIFTKITALYLCYCGIVALAASGAILFQTSQIINGGERNYIIATITLYVQIYNLFLSILQILTFISGKRE